MKILSNQLIEFVQKQSCLNNFPITSETDIIEDLGMDGDEGIDFMILYGKTFNVNLTEMFVHKYFAAEGGQFMAGMLEKIGIKKSKRKSLTVGDLQMGIEVGYLNDNMIEGKA
jgi:hypothetical protein